MDHPDIAELKIQIIQWKEIDEDWYHFKILFVTISISDQNLFSVRVRCIKKSMTDLVIKCDRMHDWQS